MFKKIINLPTRLFIRLFPSGKPILLTGAGSTIKLASLVRESGYKHPLLITGTTLLKNGHLDDLLAHFETEGLKVTIFDGTPPNPTYEVIRDGIKAVEQNSCDCLFVVGGGSAIDAAKVIAAGCANDLQVESAIGLL